MTGPERLRIQLQEGWIRGLIREELIKLLEGMDLRAYRLETEDTPVDARVLIQWTLEDLKEEGK